MVLKPCKNLDEFVRKYDKDLERILCKSFRNYINIEDLPEVKNDVYVHLLEKKFFDTYDPTKAKFSTYLYTYLFKFLKSKKVKNDKEPTNNAVCIDTPIEESGGSLLEIKDFTPDQRLVSDVLIDAQIEQKIMNAFQDNHQFKVHNPYKLGTLEYFAWDILSLPKTIEAIEERIEENFSFDYENPYHSKKDDVKHIVWNSFWKNWQKRIPVCKETSLWVNVPGVTRIDLLPETLSKSEYNLYKYIKDNTASHMELLSLGFDPQLIKALLDKGYLDEVVTKKKCFYAALSGSYLRFNFSKNLAWHLIHLMKEEHPEFIEFDQGLFHMNTKTNLSYKVLKMILSGKTKKKIATTLNISTSALNEARETMLYGIRKSVQIDF